MKKIYLFLVLFTGCFLSGNAQDTIVYKNGKRVVGKVVSVGKVKVTYTVPPDSTPKFISNWRLDYIRYEGGTQYNFTGIRKGPKPSPTELYLTAETGFSVPSINYRDGIVGTHFGLAATYYFNTHVGVSLRGGEDFNGTGMNYISSTYWGGFYIFQQYLAGLSYRTGGIPGYPWVDFVVLGGVCNVSNPVTETGTGVTGITVNTPGNGNGYGGYIGMDFTSSENHLCSFTFGLGCLGAVFSYPSNSSTFSQFDPYTNTTNNTISKSTLKTSVALFQMHLAINFRIKKAEK